MPQSRQWTFTPRIAAAMALALALAPWVGTAQGEPGSQAPAFTLSDQDGRAHQLANYRGRVVVLEWVNPSCPFTVRHARQGTSAAVARQHPEVVWLAMNSTAQGHRDHASPEDTRAFRAEHRLPHPVLSDADGRVGRAYGASHTPSVVVIDGEGRVIYRGAIDDDPFGRTQNPTNYVARALSAHAAGRSPEPASTTPYGSSVKYAP